MAVAAAVTAGLLVPTANAGGWVARHGMTSAKYQSTFNAQVDSGLRLATIDGAATAQGMRYAAIWEKTAGGRWVARHGMSATQYQAQVTAKKANGFRPIDISVSGRGNNSGTFAALWVKTGGAWVARHGLTPAQYQQAFDKFTQQGYRLRDVEGYMTKKGLRYAALWDKGGNGKFVARHGMSGQSYQAKFDKYTSQGYRLTHVDGYWTPKGVRYAAIWEKAGNGAFVARHGMTGASYQSAFNNYVGQGYALKHVSSYWDGSQLRYAAIWNR
jgi:hypothetical protein